MMPKRLRAATLPTRVPPRSSPVTIRPEQPGKAASSALKAMNVRRRIAYAFLTRWERSYRSHVTGLQGTIEVTVLRTGSACLAADNAGTVANTVAADRRWVQHDAIGTDVLLAAVFRTVAIVPLKPTDAVPASRRTFHAQAFGATQHRGNLRSANWNQGDRTPHHLRLVHCHTPLAPCTLPSLWNQTRKSSGR